MAVALIVRFVGTMLGVAVQPQPAPPAQPSSPVIVKIISPPRDPTGIADVIVGSVGLTGAIVLAAIVLGLVMAAILFWARSRNPLGH